MKPVQSVCIVVVLLAAIQFYFHDELVFLTTAHRRLADQKWLESLCAMIMNRTATKYNITVFERCEFLKHLSKVGCVVSELDFFFSRLQFERL